jgi:hypothetical protein
MDFAYSLHRIIMRQIAIEPGTVLPVTDVKNFAEMLLMGAIREATSAEIALFKMSNPDLQAAVAEAAAAEAAAAEAAAAEAAAAEAAVAEAAAAEAAAAEAAAAEAAAAEAAAAEAAAAEAAAAEAAAAEAKLKGKASKNLID